MKEFEDRFRLLIFKFNKYLELVDILKMDR